MAQLIVQADHVPWRLNKGVGPTVKPIRNLVVFSLGLTLGGYASAATLPTCPSGLAPSFTAIPKLPSRLHNEFSGGAQVSFVVSVAGHVLSPTIVSSAWEPVGRSTGQPVGYNEAILSAVAQWRYPPSHRACRHQVPVKFEFQGSSSAEAGRSNFSFEPTC